MYMYEWISVYLKELITYYDRFVPSNLELCSVTTFTPFKVFRPDYWLYLDNIA